MAKQGTLQVFSTFPLHSFTVEDNRNVNWAWDNIRMSINILAPEGLGYCELVHYKPWFDEKCSKLFGRMKQAEEQW
jgi:hypothetical protein